MSYGDGYSLSDIAAVTRNTDGSGNGNDFGGSGYGWWIIIFLIFAFMGWGNNGWGGNRGDCGSGSGSDIGAMYTLNSDFATLQRLNDSGFDRLGNRIENVNNGICDGFYSVNSAFGNLNTTLCSQFGATNNLITQNGYESRLATQSLAAQLADCCCGIKQNVSELGYKMQDCCCQNLRAIDGVNANIQNTNYNLAMNTNQIQNTLCNNTRDIIQSQENGTRAILDALTANRIEQKDLRIAELQAQVSKADDRANAQYIVNQVVDTVRPCPIPSYNTCNPWATQNCNPCGCN